MHKQSITVTREKHLDHMVRVVPLIVAGYALQCYVIMQMGTEDFGRNCLVALGLSLVSMIAGFVTYDLHHRVTITSQELEISWLGKTTRIAFETIATVEVMEKNQSFSTLFIQLRTGERCRIFFVDDADKIKAWIEEKKSPSLSQAA